MGDIIATVFGSIAILGIALVALGAIRRARTPLVIGAMLLLGITGAWVLGLIGLALGLVPLAFMRKGKATTPSGGR